MTARVTGNPAGDPTEALSALRDAGLVTDRAALNRAWSELVGRIPPTSGTRCQHRGCIEVGFPFAEPAGTWCADHRPVLWKQPTRSAWAVPRCHFCGKPGAYPNRGNGTTRPACRDHAPRWLRRYLMTTTTTEGATA